MTIGIVLCLSCLITGAIAALGDAHFFAWKEERKQKLTFIAQGSINSTYRLDEAYYQLVISR